MKSVQESEANRFCFVLTLQPPDKVKVSEGYQIVEVSGAYKHGRYEKKTRLKVCVQCPTLKFLPCRVAGQSARQTRLITKIQIILRSIKKKEM